MVRIYIDGDIEVGCSPTIVFVQGQDFVIVRQFSCLFFQDFTHCSTVQSFVRMFQRTWRLHFYLPTAAATH